jgi:hypothetical protein
MLNYPFFTVTSKNTRNFNINTMETSDPLNLQEFDSSEHTSQHGEGMDCE